MEHVGGVTDRGWHVVPFSWTCYKDSFLSEFYSGTNSLVGVGGSEPTAIRKCRDSSSYVCDVAWTNDTVDSVHHKTELATNPISDRQPV